jgi:hypothetical protein
MTPDEQADLLLANLPTVAKELDGIITAAQADNIRRHETSTSPKPRVPLVAEALGYLGTAVVLGSTGAPELPVLGGRNLAILVGEAALLVAAIVALARGFRDEAVPPVAATPVRLRATVERARGRLPRLPLVAPTATAWSRGLDFGVLVALELAAAVLIGLLLIDAAASGFL